MKDFNPVFRKAVFGGFNRQDVIEYIEKIKNDFYDYKKETDQVISELYEKINSLNTLLEKSKQENISEQTESTAQNSADDEASVSFNEISKVAHELKTAAEMICGNFENLFKRMGINELDNINSEKTQTELPEKEEELSEDIAENSISFFEDILLGLCPEENTVKSKNKAASSVSQFDDLLKI